MKEELGQIGQSSAVAMGSIVLRTLLRSSLSYAFISAAGAGLYGLLSIFLRFQRIIVSTLSGLKFGIIRTVPRVPERAQDAVVTASIPVALLLWVVISGIFATFPEEVVAATALTQSETTAVSVFGFLCLPFLFFPVYTGVFESHRRITELNLSKSVGFPLGMLVGAVGAGVAGVGLLGTWAAISFSVGVVSIVVGARIHSLHGLVLDRSFSDTVREFLRYVSEASVVSVLATVQFSGVFVLMAVFLNPLEAGLFSLAYTLSGVIRWPLDAVNQIFPPIMTSLYQDGRKDALGSLYSSTSVCIVFVSIPVAVAGIVFAPEILGMFSTRYVSNAVVLPALVLSELAAGAVGSVGNLLKMTDNQRTSIVVQAGVVTLMAGPAILLTRELGVVGLAASGAASLFLNNVLEVGAVYRVTGLSPFRAAHLWLACLGALVLVSTALSKHFNGLIAAGAVFLACASAYYWAGFRRVLGEDQRAILREVSRTVFGGLSSHLRR